MLVISQTICQSNQYTIKQTPFLSMEAQENCLDFPVELEKIKCEPDTSFYSRVSTDSPKDEYSTEFLKSQDTNVKLKDHRYAKQSEKNFESVPIIVKQENSSDSDCNERETTDTPSINSDNPRVYDSECNSTSSLDNMGYQLYTYQCQRCKRNFKHEKSFKFHVYVCEKINQNTCDAVEEITNLKRNFNSMSLTNDPETSWNEGSVECRNKFQCCICSAYFSNKIMLHNHTCGKQRKIAYPCSICPREFSLKSCLTNHMKIHKYEPGRALGECSDEFLKKPYSIDRLKSNLIEKKNMFVDSEESSEEEFILPND